MLRDVAMFFVQNVVVFITLAVGIATPIAALKRRLSARLCVRTALAVLLAAPLIAIATVLIFDLPPGFRTLILLVGITPPVPFFLVQIREDRSAALVVLATASLAAPFTVPFWLWVTGSLVPIELAASPLTIATTILTKMILPLAVGLGLQVAAPRAARALAPWMKRLAIVAIVVAVLVALMAGRGALADMTWQVLVAMIVSTVGALIAGDLLGRPDPVERKALSTAACFGNPPLAIALVAAALPDLRARAIAVVCGYVLLRVVILKVASRLLSARGPRAHRGAQGEVPSTPV